MARQDANHDQADRQTLASLCTRPLETGAFLRLAASITAALAPIHKQNIIHANIRPQNIFLDCQTGEVTLSGYCPESRGPWASPLTYSAGASGETLLYMSPEQTGRVKRRVDYRTDFYSLGVTFYQLLTARPIFHGRDAQEYASAISYLGTDIGLLSQDSWEVMYELSLGLHLCKAECEYLSGNLEEADRLISAILPQAGSRADAAEGLSSSLGALDTIAVVNASQAISKEIEFPKLLETLMRTVIEHAGAQKGYLFRLHGDTVAIEAEASVEGEQIGVALDGDSAQDKAFPASIINYVMHTRESLILDNATEANSFLADPYIVEFKPLSVLCLPILRQTNLVGMLYLENRLVEGVFTAGKIAFLELLAAQTAISIENASLYLERSRAEETLRKSEEKYRTLIEHSLQGVVIIQGAPPRPVFANPFITELTGYSVKEFLSLSPQKAIRIMHPKDRGQWLHNYLERTAGRASPQRYESRIIRKDGQVRWVQIFANVIQYMDKPAVQAVFIDITEQKLSEQALRESENRLSQVIDFLPEPTFAIDTDGKLIVWNKAMEELSGYSAKQMVGKANHEYALPFYKGDRCKTLIDLVLNSDEGLEKKYRFIRRNGDTVTAEVDVLAKGKPAVLSGKASALHDSSGHIAGAIECMSDITDRVQAENKIRDHAESLMAVNRIATICTSSLELETILEHVLSEILDIGGFETGAICLKSPDGASQLVIDSARLNAKGSQKASRLIENDLCRGCTLKDRPLRCPMPVMSEEKIPALVDKRDIFRTAFPLLVQQECLGVICVFASGKPVVAEHKLSLLETLSAQVALGVQNALLYKEIREHADTLERRVQERTVQLETANRELESFSYSVSHDLRSPLRGINGWSQALMEDCRDQLDHKGQAYLDRIRLETQKMGTLIDGLLELSRVSRREVTFEIVDMSSIARTLAGRLQEEQPERKVEFVIEPGLIARGDPRLLEVMLSNLFANAWKFTGKHKSALIEFGRTLIDGMPAWFVRDDGAGFDPAYARRLFGPFQRMHRTSDFPGNGIGLATVQRIINRHGGRIWAEAQKEKGACFYFTL